MVRVGLLDVNAMIALLWKQHPFHEACVRWMVKGGRSGWATCAITEAGFVRIVCNPAFTKQAPSVHQAISLLESAKEHQPGHHFWRDELSMAEAAAHWNPPLGHKQVTDAYLLGLVHRYKGTMVTFDQRIQHLARLANLEPDVLTPLKQ